MRDTTERQPEGEVAVLPRTTEQPSRSAIPPATAAGVPASTSSSAPPIAATRAERAPVQAPRPVAVAATTAPPIAPEPRELKKSSGPSAVSRLLPWVLAALGIVIVVGVFHVHPLAVSPPSVSDADIIHSIQTRFAADPELSKCTVEAKSQNGIVTLTGLVNKESDKTSAAGIAREQAGVKQVNTYALVISTSAPPPTGGETAGGHSVMELQTPNTGIATGEVQPETGYTGAGGPGVVKTVTVPGNQPWTATGVFLNPGAVVKISASGGVSFSLGSKPGPPAGDPPDCLTVANGPYGWRANPYVANELPCSSLLARIGDKGVIFYV